ncbi:MAG: hypothetical protein RLZZ337_988 [Bacteroidota bacterium]|jgi:photosystem II stability/assembly factor-like uncharacterized protein
MKKILQISFLSFVIGCTSSKNTITTQVPPKVEFEVERLKSPITGEVPSHLRYAYLPKVMGNKDVRSKTKVYPNTWQVVDDKMATLSISKIVYDPNNLKTFYFCTGEGWFNADAARGNGVWKSTNAGETWFHLPSTDSSDFFYCQDIIVHPSTSDVYVATREGGLQRSKDGGNTWEQVLGGGNGSTASRAADLELTADGDIVIGMGIFNTDGIYISKTGDAGSWQKIVTGLPSGGYERLEIATAKSNANVMYVIPQSANTNKIMGVWKSDDKGQNWVQKESPGGDLEMAKVQAWYDLIIEVDPNDENTIVAGGLNLWRSKDGGDSWGQITEGDKRKTTDLQYVHVDQHEIVFQNSDTVYFLNDGGLYRTDNFTQDTPVLYDINTNYNTTQFYSVDMHPSLDGHFVVGGTQDNGTNGSLTDGISEFYLVSWADGGYSAIDYEDPDYVYSTTQEKRVYRNVDGRRDTITNPLITDANTLFINPFIMDATNPQTLYQASNVGVWSLENARTADTSNWKRICRPLGVVTALATSTAAPNTVFFGRTQLPMRIDNANTTDETYIPAFLDKNAELPTNGYINCVVPDDLDKNHLILIYSNYDMNSVYETFDAYADDPTWRSCEGNLPNIPIRWGCFKNGSSYVFYVATELGVYSTDKLDGENTNWQPTNEGLPNLRMDLIKSRKSDNKFVVASHGRGIFVGEANAENNTITWTERGPSNVGGRSRALMIDPNDPTQKKLWAGSVSGGLWVAQNVDSVAQYIEIAGSTELNVFPNPAYNQLLLKFNENNPNAIRVSIYNNLGQLVLQKTVENSGEYLLDINGLANGVLYVNLKQGDEEITKKIIKQTW